MWIYTKKKSISRNKNAGGEGQFDFTSTDVYTLIQIPRERQKREIQNLPALPLNSIADFDISNISQKEAKRNL